LVWVVTLYNNWRLYPALTKFCALSIAECLTDGQLVLSIFLNCEHKALETDVSHWKSTEALHTQPASLNNLIPLIDGHFHRWFRAILPTECPLHYNHRSPLAIPEHTLTFLYLRHYLPQLRYWRHRWQDLETQRADCNTWSNNLT